MNSLPEVELDKLFADPLQIEVISASVGPQASAQYESCHVAVPPLPFSYYKNHSRVGAKDNISNVYSLDALECRVIRENKIVSHLICQE